MLELAVAIKPRTSKCGQGSQIKAIHFQPRDGDTVSETDQHAEVSYEDVVKGW